LLSEVVIASPLHAHREGLVAKQPNHIAFCPSIETVSGPPVGRPEDQASHTFR
jgi:hypothetical protein